MKLKYVKTAENDMILFSELMEHRDFCSLDVVSAGFVSICFYRNGLDMECYGKSVSLNIESNPIEDTKILKDFYICGKELKYLIVDKYFVAYHSVKELKDLFNDSFIEYRIKDNGWFKLKINNDNDLDCDVDNVDYYEQIKKQLLYRYY